MASLHKLFVCLHEPPQVRLTGLLPFVYTDLSLGIHSIWLPCAPNLHEIFYWVISVTWFDGASMVNVNHSWPGEIPCALKHLESVSAANPTGKSVAFILSNMNNATEPANCVPIELLSTDNGDSC